MLINLSGFISSLLNICHICFSNEALDLRIYMNEFFMVIGMALVVAVWLLGYPQHV